jgi:alpha-D-ribose 1-methylphosphonate 5-triphosphate synthase subunit PhnG
MLAFGGKTATRPARRLNQLVGFMRRMGREKKQVAVAVVINDVFHEITEF